MSEYEFQWGGAHTFSSIFDRSCFTYGPQAFGKPHIVDYVAFGKNGKVDCYISNAMVQEWAQMGQRLLDPSFSDEYLALCKRARGDMNAFCKKFKSTDLNTASASDLCGWADALTQHIRIVGGLFVATQQAGTRALEADIRKRVQDVVGPKNAEQAFATVSQPVQMDIVNREQLDFGYLALQDAAGEGDLRAHADKHAWLFYQTYDSAAAMRFLKKRLKNLQVAGQDQTNRGLKQFKESKNELANQQATIFEKLEPIFVHKCRLLQQLALERLELKNHWAGADWRFLPLFKQISKRLSVPLIDLIQAYGLDEVKSGLAEGRLLTPQIARERRECYAVRNHNGTRTYIGGIDAVQTLKKTLYIKEPIAEHPVVGTVANPGQAKGPAYIVTVGGLDELVKDEANFPQGAVMVVKMTQPNQLALVKKACAIVADEGGTVSHAAVLAREMGKPCIVGTKVATRTFKTGDWVDVDADVGVVRKSSPKQRK